MPLIHFLDKIYQALNKPEKFTLEIFIDLTKAFHTCDIDILLKRLDHYRFRWISNQWFENYLKRKKAVYFN